MTHKIGNIVTLEKTLPDKCELCGKIDELRPYGPNREAICFDCAMQDEEMAKRRFAQAFFEMRENDNGLL